LELLQRPAESEAARLRPRQEEHQQVEVVRKGLKQPPCLLRVLAELLAVLPVLWEPEYPPPPFQPDSHTGCRIRATPL
jgi:hypothetical protein